MKRFYVSMLAGLLLLGACGPATGITVRDGWARPALQGGNGAVYFLAQNHSTSADELLSVSSDIAEAVELHQTTMANDIMQMQQVKSVPIDGKESIAFAPGGLHVMLIGLKRDLKIGDEFQITLQFAGQEDIMLTIPVQATAEGAVMSDH